MIFGQFKCGCVAIIDVSGELMIVLYRCTEEEDDLIFHREHRRDNPDLNSNDNKFTPFDQIKTHDWVRYIADHIYYGKCFKEQRRLNSVPIRDKEDYRLF